MILADLLYAVVLFLVVGLTFSTIAEWLKLGSIFGLLIAGVALGPHSPGPVLTDDVTGLLGLAEVGVVLLMFTIGLEMRPSRLWAMRKYLLGLGPAQVLVCALLLMTGLTLTSTLSANAKIIVGFGLALSSTAIAMQILAEKGEVGKRHGQATFAILILQDIAAVPLLILVPILSVANVQNADGNSLMDVGIMLGALVGVTVLGYALLPRFLGWAARKQSTANFGVLVLVAVLFAALVMEEAGLSMAMGAFILGVLLSVSDYRYQVEISVLPLKGVFMALFFVAVGMSIDIDLAVATGPMLFAYLAMVVSLKLTGSALVGRLFGLDWGDSLRTSSLISQSGEFGFVLFALAANEGLLSEQEFALAVVVISLSMAITPFVVRAGYWFADSLASSTPAQTGADPSSEALQDHVIVAGYNRIGRLMCIMLTRTGTPHIAFDIDPARVAGGRAEGANLHLGDVTNPLMHGVAAFARAKVIVVALEDIEKAARLVEHLRSFYPHLAIQMAAQDLATQNRMREMGVMDVICTQVEGGLQLGQTMLHAAGVSDTDIDDLSHALRIDDYAAIRDSSPGVQHATSIAGTPPH